MLYGIPNYATTISKLSLLLHGSDDSIKAIVNFNMFATVDSISKQVQGSVDFHASFIGAPGKALVRKKLKGLESINELQDKCNFTFPTCRPALQFLDALHTGPNSTQDSGILFEIHRSLLDNLKSSLEEKLVSLSEYALTQMLRQTIKYIIIPDLKAIPISIIRRMKGTIHTNLCKFLASDKICHIVQELPLAVRMQVWAVSPQLFLDSIKETCTACLGQLTKAVAAGAPPLSASELRSQGAPARQLSNFIGQSDTLFAIFADFCAKGCIESNHTWGAVVQHVLMCMAGAKLKPLLMLHDLALIIDQVKRDGLDLAAFDAIIQIFKSLIRKHKTEGDAEGEFLVSTEEAVTKKGAGLGSLFDKKKKVSAPVQTVNKSHAAVRKATSSGTRRPTKKRRRDDYLIDSDDDNRCWFEVT